MTISWLFLNQTQVKEELRNQRAQYLHLIQNIPEVVWRARESGDAIFISERIADVFGYTVEEVLRHGAELWFGRMHPEDRDRVKHAYAELFRGGRRFDVQYRIQHRDGHWMWWHDRAQMAGDASDNYADGLLSDISHMKALEARVQHAQKMEAVGQLAGGVAHDFNNLLQVIAGYAEMLEGRHADDAKTVEHTARIKAATRRAQGLTEQLLGFSRKQLQHVAVLDLNETVSRNEARLASLLGRRIHLEVHLSVAPLWIKADAAQMEQVLMNLVLNAQDAMPEGGNLIIETARFDGDKGPTATTGGVSPGEYVSLSVVDTGMGMDASTLSRVFEPFFTSKAPGKGLGLATVYGIIKQSGGDVLAKSEPGKGSSFHVFLPAAKQEEGQRTVASVRRHSPEKRTILLTEDEPEVRDVTSVFLEKVGYRVHCAGDGQAALDFADRFAGNIHLLLTDMVMPGCSGTELAAKLCSKLPGMKVLYMTGYSNDRILRHQLQGSQVAILRKPFTRDQLISAVGRALDGPNLAQLHSGTWESASHPS